MLSYFGRVKNYLEMVRNLKTIVHQNRKKPKRKSSTIKEQGWLGIEKITCNTDYKRRI